MDSPGKAREKFIVATTFLVSTWIIVLADAWRPAFSSPTRSSNRSSKSTLSSVVHFGHSKTESIEVVSGAWNSTQFGATGCWGQRPLFWKGAFLAESSPSDDDDPSFSLPTWNEILELACCTNKNNSDDDDNINNNDDDMAESLLCRLIRHQPGALDSFSLEFGPFLWDVEELSAILHGNDDTSASTLVVNDVDRWIPDLSDWMDTTFDRLPRWRRDDAQISLADVGGGIGPHVDNYDVFLIQSSGHREWEIGLEPISVQYEFDHLEEASQVRILKETGIPTIKLHLEPGDCLYLPPRFQHCGIATSSNCVTLSVGCRAPSAADILSKVAESIATSALGTAVCRYSDRRPLWEDHPPSTMSNGGSSGSFPIQQLTGSIKNDMKAMVRNLIEDVISDDVAWDDLVGKLVTEPNRPVLDYPVPLYELDDEWKDDLGIWGNAETALQAVLAGKGVLRRAEGVSFVWSARSPPNSFTCKLYAQGRSFSIDSSSDDDFRRTGRLLERICSGKPISKTWLEEEMGNTSGGGKLSTKSRVLLETLLDEGFLYGDDSA